MKCIEAGGEDLIVTSHAGKAYDIGCISVRRLVSRDTEDKAGDRVELAVVWSAYQDVMPVFCLAASPAHIITLEVVTQTILQYRLCLRLLQISCDGCKQYVL